MNVLPEHAGCYFGPSVVQWAEGGQKGDKHVAPEGQRPAAPPC